MVFLIFKNYWGAKSVSLFKLLLGCATLQIIKKKKKAFKLPISVLEAIEVFQSSDLTGKNSIE